MKLHLAENTNVMFSAISFCYYFFKYCLLTRIIAAKKSRAASYITPSAFSHPMANPMERLGQWLKVRKLPDTAVTCLENFVCSCRQAGGDDVANFVCIDIADFSPTVQERLIEGFMFAYYGIEPEVYRTMGMLVSMN